MDTAWGADYDVGSLLESLHVIPDTSAANTSVALHADEITESHNNLLNLLRQFPSRRENQGLTGFDVLVNLLEDGDGEGRSLSGARLGLSNDIGA
jgi:hypothetical protein